MIFRTHNATSPTVNISFDGVAVDYLSIVQIQLELTENQHDLVRIKMAGIPPTAITDYIDAPVSVSWSQGAASNKFVGYVVYIEPEYKNNQGMVNNSPFQSATIYCVGASFDMRGKKATFWENTSLQDIVSKLADEYRYSYSIPVDTFKFFRLAQDGRSDWEFLVDVADSLGYSVTAHGTHLHVFDRYKALGRSISYNVLDTIGKSLESTIRPGLILSFKGSFGKVTPTGTSNDDDISSVDNRGKLVAATTKSRDSGSGRPIKSRFTDQISMSLVSSDYAERYLEARARKKFPFSARVELSGTSGIKPGGIVNVDKFNAKFDGLWYVSGVTHTITLDKFSTELLIIRDSTNDDPFRITPVKSVGEVPDPVLRESYWGASTQMEEIYG